MVVTIQERVALSRDGYQAQSVPANLLVFGASGQKYLKIQPSSPTIVRLCCAHSEDLLELYSKCKNPSLSSSEKLKGLKELLEAEVVKNVDEMNSAQDDVADKIWGENKGSSASKVARPKLPQETPEQLQISVTGYPITCSV